MFLMSLIYGNLHSEWHPYYIYEYLLQKRQSYFYSFFIVPKCHPRQLRNPLAPAHPKVLC